MVARVATKPGPALDLYDTQAEFVFDAHRLSAFVAGRGAGKTYCGAIKALSHARRPGLGLIIAPTYTMLRDVDWRAALELWRPWIADTNSSAMTMRLTTGAEVLFRSADNADRLRGLTVSWAWIDEAALCSRDTWDIALATLRQGGTAGPCWLTSTPRGFNWVYDVFVTGANADTALFQTATIANPFLDPAFERSLRSQYSSEFAEQELGGQFIILGAGLFRPEWWQRYSAFDRSNAREIIQVWDTAFSEKTSADYSVCATWAEMPTGYYVLDIYREQVGFPELKRAAVDLYQKWQPTAVLIEAKASGQSLLQELQRETRMPVVAVKVDADKVTRANAVTATVEAGNVSLPEQAEWVRSFIEEHGSFPLGNNDDQVDTTVMALRRWIGQNDVSSFLASVRRV